MSSPHNEILLVEDDPDDVELTLYAFKRNHMLNPVTVVRDGAEALDYIFGTADSAPLRGRTLPRVILLDLKLPRMDGLAVLKRLKQDPRTRAIPVVMLTSSGREEDLYECYDAGANSYVRKPVDFVRFVEAVRTLGLYWLLWNEPPEQN